jgi:transposase
MRKSQSTAPYDKRTRRLVIHKQQEGKSHRIIRQETGVSRSIQISWKSLFKEKGIDTPVVRNHKGIKNPRCKVDQKYLEKLKTLINAHHDWSNHQLQTEMHLLTGIELKKTAFANWIRKVHGTRKLFSKTYVESKT